MYQTELLSDIQWRFVRLWDGSARLRTWKNGKMNTEIIFQRNNNPPLQGVGERKKWGAVTMPGLVEGGGSPLGDIKEEDEAVRTAVRDKRGRRKSWHSKLTSLPAKPVWTLSFLVLRVTSNTSPFENEPISAYFWPCFCMHLSSIRTGEPLSRARQFGKNYSLFLNRFLKSF